MKLLFKQNHGKISGRVDINCFIEVSPFIRTFNESGDRDLAYCLMGNKAGLHFQRLM